MGFKKVKKTFLSQAGRQGAPSARKPFAKKNTKATAKARGSANGKNTIKTRKLVVKNGHPLKTTHVTPNKNAKTGKDADSFNMGPGVAKRLSNYFAKGPKLSSATNSPQSTSNTVKPKG